MDIFNELIESWTTTEGINSTSELISWINFRNSQIAVKIEKIPFLKSNFWYYDIDKGIITNKNQSFFSIAGIQKIQNDLLVQEQPIIIQNEIGFLGIICKKIDGVLHFLMQAKIEPGNINKIQISPTIQATKSNFMQKHGGRKPKYLEYFINAHPKTKIVDQIQSEQSLRFLKKRNRNVIIYVNYEINETEDYKWMTLGQIKSLMKIDNLVNMDTRTVVSCIPFSTMSLLREDSTKHIHGVSDRAMYNSINKRANQSTITEIYHKINDFKMFQDYRLELTNLYSLKNWELGEDRFFCKEDYPFSLIFCDIKIEGREVTEWNQPLLKAEGEALFGLFCMETEGKKMFLVKPRHEVGSFDSIEIGPTVQREFIDNEIDDISSLFIKKMNEKEGIIIDVMLSEEGGRFYHEQNRNVIIQIECSDINIEENSEYNWVDFATLNTLMQVNNTINIQLRNLLSLLEV